MRPLVSVGLPVYNGGNHLRSAIDAVLTQSYKNLELIISDNASTDQTPEICREAAGRDQRVRVYRNEVNRGAAFNYNRVWHLSRGRFFKWAAHDDILTPEFVESALQVLESNPDVVLCTSRTGRIDDLGIGAGTYSWDPCWDSCSVSERFRSLVMNRHSCVAIFGLIRKNALEGTPLIAPYVGSDRVLLAELGLRGRLNEVQRLLLFRRDHPGCSVRSFPDPRDRIVWFDPSKLPAFSFPEWREVIGYGGALWRTPLAATARGKCLWTVILWSASRWRQLFADFKHAGLTLIAGKQG